MPDPGSDPHEATPVDPAPPPAALAETHSSVVFFVGDRAYKLKKPVDLGFLDFRTREARQAVCHDEVTLNRRLEPDVYLGVADVTGPDGSLCDHLVVMRRMPDDRRLSTLVRSGAPVDQQVWHIAHRVAAFHAACPREDAADEAAGVEATRRRWEANTAAMLEMPRVLDTSAVATVQELASRYLAGRQPLLASRIAEGRAVDGHGDLQADDIFCLDDGPRILDCLEFDQALRVGDGLADAAFLAMDLERLGRPDLGWMFLDAYRQHSADVWPRSLAHHQIAYRAQVRAKVRAIRAQQGDADAHHEAVGLLEIATDHLEAARVRLVLVGGLPGTGKSTLASGVGDQIDATVIVSDELRKELAGLPIGQAAPASFEEGIYTQEATDRTYAALLDRAASLLAMGESVVLDASWTDARWRQRARDLAATQVADLTELRCETSRTVAHERIAQRAATGGSSSDATAAIADAMATRDLQWPEATAIDTSRNAATSRAKALEVAQRRWRQAPAHS